MTTPDSSGPGGAQGTFGGGLAAGPGDDAGERDVNAEARGTRSGGAAEDERLRSVSVRTGSGSGGTDGGDAGDSGSGGGGLAAGGAGGPDLTEQDEQTAADPR